jgi:TonB family protein
MSTRQTLDRIARLERLMLPRDDEDGTISMTLVESSNNPVMLGGAAFTLCRDGGILYADGKLDWDYTPLAKVLLAKGEQLDPTNLDVFSVVPELPHRGERPAPTLRAGATETKNLRSRVDPVYPPAAQAAGIQGAVAVNILVGLDGHVVRAAATSGPDQLREAAAAAVRQWDYKPTSLNGKPVYILTRATLNFQLRH